MISKMMVVLSGGQDSTTCLHWALAQGAEVRAVFVNYGQRHIRERLAARAQAHLARIPYTEINVPAVLVGTSPLVSSTPLEQYENWNTLPGGLEKTFVPMRNQLFLTLAANRAVAWGCNQLVTGVCEEDFGGYPDCRKTFILAMEAAVRLGTFLDPEAVFKIQTPLMHLNKRQTVELALSLPGCYGALGFSHTSYDGAYPPTGQDHATLLRAKGFAQAGVPDPLVVRAYWEERMELPQQDNYATHQSVIANLKPNCALWRDQDENPDYTDFLADRLNQLTLVL